MFKKDALDFTGNTIHNFGKVAPGARVKVLPPRYFVHHFNAYTAKSYLEAMDRYTDIQGGEARATPGLLRLTLSTLKTIVVHQLFRGGYKGGHASAFLTAQLVYYNWLNAMKLYENNNHLDRGAIERKNDVFRDEILKTVK